MGVLVWIVNFVFQLFTVLILVRAVLSWVYPNPYHPAVRLLHRITDPILAPIQRIIPPLGGLDISPVVALILLEIVRRLLLALV